MALCFVSIGSNVERERNVRGALRALRSRFGPLLISSIYETPAVGFTGDPFFNLVVGFVSDDTPQQVASSLREIEAQHGRTRNGERFGPRTLDIDLLLYGDETIDDHGLQLPRSEIERHAFVLKPLAEIAPDLRHPITQCRYDELWRSFAGDRAGTRVTLAIDE